MRPLRRLTLTLLALVLATTAHAQGVGINASGAAADTSAILDLSATNKGFLPPRMTAAQRTAIVQPATGLLVYQTDGAAGLWYNAGTSGAPNWKQVMDATTGTGPWSLNGTNAYYNGGRVGIGTSSPTHRFMVLDDNSGLRVQTNLAGGTVGSFGGYGAFQVDAPGVVGGRLTLLENGNLGLGVANPTNKLSFAATLGKKISLYPGATGDAGFGMAGNRLQIYGDNPNADVALGYDVAGTFNERFAFKPTGAMAVNGNAGVAGQVLQSNGSASAATWVAPTKVRYENLYSVVSTTATTVPAWNRMTLPDLTRVVTVTGNAKIVIDYTLLASDPSCALCAGAPATGELLINGVVTRGNNIDLANGGSGFLRDRYVATVGAGTYTIAIAGHSNSKADTFGHTSAEYGNSLIVEVIPQ